MRPRALTRRCLLALAGAAALSPLLGCTGVGAAPVLSMPRMWLSPHGADHRLTGRCFAPAEGRYLDEAAVAARFAAARYVLLGETHDNPDHHLLQAQAIRALVDAGRRPAVAFEMIAANQADALARHLAEHPGDAAGLGAALGWERSGWPEWPLYRPIAEAALAAGLPLSAANLEPAIVRAIAKGDDVGAALVARLGFDKPWPDELEATLEREIAEAHCGYVEADALKAMALGQRARDAEMARRLIEAATPDGAVLIAGSGHCRADRGVPYHLRSFEPGATVASLVFVEVSRGKDEPAAYAADFDVAALPFDVVCFTARVDERDACERFKEQLEKMRKPPTKGS